jgi:hypothetical protein
MARRSSAALPLFGIFDVAGLGTTLNVTRAAILGEAVRFLKESMLVSGLVLHSLTQLLNGPVYPE